VVSGNGNSQHQIDYSYIDNHIGKTQNTIFYRLKQIDFDGAFEYSSIRVVHFKKEVDFTMGLTAYPNPFSNEVTVALSLPLGETYNLEVTNLNRLPIYKEDYTFTTGIHKLDLSEWSSGIYIVRVVSNHETKGIKIIKQ